MAGDLLLPLFPAQPGARQLAMRFPQNRAGAESPQAAKTAVNKSCLCLRLS